LGLECLEDAVKTEIRKRDDKYNLKSPVMFSDSNLPEGI
jgi:hypothetical protein